MDDEDDDDDRGTSTDCERQTPSVCDDARRLCAAVADTALRSTHGPFTIVGSAAVAVVVRAAETTAVVVEAAEGVVVVEETAKEETEGVVVEAEGTASVTTLRGVVRERFGGPTRPTAEEVVIERKTEAEAKEAELIEATLASPLSTPPRLRQRPLRRRTPSSANRRRCGDAAVVVCGVTVAPSSFVALPSSPATVLPSSTPTTTEVSPRRFDRGFCNDDKDDDSTDDDTGDDDEGKGRGGGGGGGGGGGAEGAEGEGEGREAEGEEEDGCREDSDGSDGGKRSEACRGVGAAATLSTAPPPPLWGSTSAPHGRVDDDGVSICATSTISLFH